jgi:hypothetical protein
VKQPERGRIEKPENAVNVPWQTRLAPPTAYENRLADALEQVFAAGALELPELVRELNRLGVTAPDGSAWTEASFQQTFERLGA